MSRTYRKTFKKQKRDWIYKGVEKDKEVFYNKHPHRWKDWGDWLDHMTTPSWWVREMMTRPQRAKVRALLRKIIKEEVDCDEVVFPSAKKPFIYYW